jgi:elongation factor Ts
MAVQITADMVRDLRERTGAGMMDCKKALTESGGDLAKAEEVLRKKGISSAAKKAGRVAAEGLVGSYIHNGKIGVLVEVNCETDFVARNEAFQALVKDVAMHIVAANPRYVRREEVPPEVLEKEREIERALLKAQKRPDHIVEKALEGKVAKYYERECLLDQPWFREDKKKVSDVLTEAVAKIGENITVRRFARFVVGEGIEKKKDDLAGEVARATGVGK